METISLLHKSRQKEFKAAVHPQVSEKVEHIDFDDVSRLEFLSAVSLKSLLWSVIFFMFFLDLCLRRNPDNWFFSSIAAMSVGLGILAIILADKQYYILVYMNDGTKIKVGLDKENRKAAEKFVTMVNNEI
jgi:hypothetical protein